MVSGDSLTISHTLESVAGKGKAIVFIKYEPESLGKEPWTQCMVTEVSAGIVDYIQLLLNEIYMPLLSNPHVQEGWGDVVSKELGERLHGFIANVGIAVGQTKGETCLPLPPPEILQGQAEKKNIISLLEGAIITWTKQIKNVLKLDPETPLKRGKSYSHLATYF
jgi:dynein heavy chain